MADLNTYLRGLPQGNRPWDAWKTRELYLQKILRKGSYSEEEKQRIIANYIGPEPENVDVSNTVSGYLDRTAAMTKNSAMIGINQVRQYLNSIGDVDEEDKQDAREAYDEITRYRGLQASIPRDEGALGVAQDVVSSLPSLVENMAASVAAGYVGGKIGAGVGSIVMPGAGTAIGAGLGFVSGWLASLGVNATMEASSAFDDNLRNEEIRTRLEAKYGNNPQLVETAQKAIAHEVAEATAWRNVFDPTNIAAGLAGTKMATKAGQAFVGFFVGKKGAKTRFPNKGRITKDTVGGTVQEAVQESHQDVIQQSETLYQIAKLDAEADPDSDRIPDRLDVLKDIDYGRVAYSGLIGGIAGGGFSGSRSAIGKYADSKREKIRQEIRNAIDSGDLDQFNLVRNIYEEGSPERVIIDQEISDIKEGIHVDHRVDKDLTRYDMRNELANAMAEGKSGFEAFIKKNRNNPLFSDIVNDYFDKLRSAEVTAQQEAELERIRNQLLLGFDPMVGTEADEQPTQRGWQLTDENLRDTMTQPDPEGRWGGEPGVRVDTPYTPQDWATRTERKGPPKRLEDLTKPKSQRQVQEKKEAKPAPEEDIDIDKITSRSKLIDIIRTEQAKQGIEMTGEEARRLMKSGKRGGSSVGNLKKMARDLIEANKPQTKTEPTQEAQPKPKAKPKEEAKPREPEPVPEVSPERQAEIEQIREEFLDDFTNKDMGGFKLFRHKPTGTTKDNTVKEVILTRGEEERTYTSEDLDEMGYLSNNKENFLEGKVRNDLAKKQEPEVLADTDQQTETKEVSQEQVTEPEAVVEEEPTVVEPTKVEAEPPAETAPEPVEETREEATPEGEASPELVLNFMSTLDPDENNYVIDEIRGRNNKFEGVQVDTYDTVNQEWSTKEFTADEARALQIVNKKNKVIPSAIQDYVRRAAIYANPKGPAGTPDQEIEMERTATFTETEYDQASGTEAEAQTAGTLRPTEEAEARLTPVEIRSSVQSAMDDELASPTAEDLRDIEGGRDAEVGFTENEIAYNKTDGTTFIADELKEAGIKNSQQKKPVAEMAEALQLKELSDLDGVTFVKGTDKNKNHYQYEKGQFAGGSVNGISQNLLDKLQTFAKNKGYTLSVIDEKTPLPTIEGVYKDPQKYPLLVAQAIKKTFGSASKFQNSISSNDPKGIRIYSIQPGETPVAGETVEDTGMNKDDKLLEATRRISSDGIADGFVAPLYVERRAKAEVQEEGKAPTKAELEAIEKGADQEVEQEVKQDETVEYEKVEGEYVVNLFIDDDKDVAGVKGRAVSAIRIPFKGVTEKQLVDFIEALRSPETKKKVLLDKPLFSIAPDREVSNGPLDRTVLDKAVGEFTREFRGGVMLNFKTYDSPQQAQQETGIEFNPKARGALVGDQVYLFANNLKDVATARKVIFHESIGHYGVRNVLGDEDFNLFLDRVVTNNKSEVQAIAERYQKAGVFKDIGETELRIAAEELVAEAAEGRANRTVIQRIIEALRDFFAKHLGLLEPNEIKSIVLRAEKAFRTGEIYFGADRSVFGPAMDARYALGIWSEAHSRRFSADGGKHAAYPEALLKAAKALSDQFAQVSENPADVMKMGEDLREAYISGDLVKANEIYQQMFKFSQFSMKTSLENGGFYMLPDGMWRWVIPDFIDGEPSWNFKMLPDNWYEQENDSKYFDEILDVSDKTKFKRITDSNGEIGYVVKLEDFADHPLKQMYPEIWRNTEIYLTSQINRPTSGKAKTDKIALKSGGGISFGDSVFTFSKRGGKSGGIIPDKAFKISVEMDTSPLYTLEAFVHELTHAVQKFTNAGGGSSLLADTRSFNSSLFNDVQLAVNELTSTMSDTEISLFAKKIYDKRENFKQLLGVSPFIDTRFDNMLKAPKEAGMPYLTDSYPAYDYDAQQTISLHLFQMFNTNYLLGSEHVWLHELLMSIGEETKNPKFQEHAGLAYGLFSTSPNWSNNVFGKGIDADKRRVSIGAKQFSGMIMPDYLKSLERNLREGGYTGTLTPSEIRVRSEIYERTWGETEARDFQYKFGDSYRSYRKKDITDDRKNQEISAIQERYRPLSLGLRHNINNEFFNAKGFDHYALQDLIMNPTPGRPREDLKLDDLAQPEYKKKPIPGDEVRYSIASERDDNSFAPTWMSQAEKDVFLKFGNPHAGKSIREKFEKLKENWWTKVRQGMFDKFAPLKYLSDKSYILARMSKSTDGPFSAMFQLGHIFMDEDGAIDVDTTKKSLVESMRPLGQDMDTFLRWVASNRAYDLKKGPKGRDALKFLTDAEIAVGMNFNRGTTINAETGQRISRKKLFDDVLKDFQAVQNSVLDLAVKSGAVSKENAQLWKDQFYVPFYRVFDEDPAKRIGPNTIDGLVGQDAFKTLRGSDRGLADLLQNTMMNYHHLIDVSLKNKAATQSVSDLMQIDGAVKLGKYPINNEAMREYFENLEGADQQMTALVQPDNGQTIYIRENGERVYYRISDPFVLEALMSMNSVNKDNPIYKVLRGSKRWFTYAVTADPDFKIANLLRDTIGSIAVAPLGYNPLSNVARGWKGTKKDSKTYSKLVAGGGAFIFGNVSGTDPTSEGAKRLIEQGVKEEFIIDSPKKLGLIERTVKASFGLARGAWGKYEDFGTRLENINRAALYDQLRDPKRKDKDGNRIPPKSHLEASYEARDLMDFSNSGSWGMIQYLSQWSPFLNARLQGMYKLGRGATSPAQRAQFATTVFAYSMASLGLYLLYKDDEEFKEREEWDRDTYHWFKVPGFDTAIRIPKAFEVGTITTMVERMAEQMIDEEATGELFRERMLYAVTNTLAMDIRPQLLRPIIDIYSNKNPFTGRDIESMKMEGLNIEEKRNAFTSETATLLSRMNADTIGWDAVNLSPVQIEYAVQGFSAWVGTSVLAATDSLIRMADGKEAPGEGLKSVPVIGLGVAVLEPSYRRFVDDLSRPRRNTKYVSQFYEQMREMNQTFSSIRELRQLGEMDRAMEKEKEERVLLRYRTTYNKLQRRVSKLRTQMQRIANDPNMDGDLKQMRIDRIQAQINANIKVLQRRTNIQLRKAS